MGYPVSVLGYPGSVLGYPGSVLGYPSSVMEQLGIAEGKRRVELQKYMVWVITAKHAAVLIAHIRKPQRTQRMQNRLDPINNPTERGRLGGRVHIKVGRYVGSRKKKR